METLQVVKIQVVVWIDGIQCEIIQEYTMVHQ